jgi:hypothetical protein
MLCRTFALLLLLATPAAAQPVSTAQRLVEGAYAQVGVTLLYDSSYRRIAFPGGDVPLYRGVCSDVIVRAYRAVGVDLQRLVNQDMRGNFAAYPNLWGLAQADANIDHRRVPNLAAFFTRQGGKLPVSRAASDYRAGDVVTWRLPNGHVHIGLVADRRVDGRPLVVHNIGWGTQIEDVLFAFEISGHYRYLPDWR